MPQGRGNATTLCNPLIVMSYQRVAGFEAGQLRVSPHLPWGLVPANRSSICGCFPASASQTSPGIDEVGKPDL